MQLDPEKFKFLICDPSKPGEEPDPCAICHENPYAYVPDYRMMGEGETFFNGKNCTQSIVLTFPAPGPVGPGPSMSELGSNSFQESEKERAVRLMLDYFNKASEVTVFKYVEVIPDDDTRGNRYGADFGPTIATAAVTAATAEKGKNKSSYFGAC